MAYEKIVTVYDTEEHAKEAARALEAAGFSSSDISLLNKGSFGEESTDTTTARQPGFWGRLFGGDVQEHEAEVYGRSVEQGGYVLTLRVPDTEVDRAMKILDTHKSVDVSDRATSYGLDPSKSRSLAGSVAGGIGGAAAAGAGTVGGVAGGLRDAVGRGTDAIANTGRAAVNSVSGTAARTAETGRGAVTGEDEVLKLAEEQLTVGKRQVESGTTRIRRFVTEKPVEEQVSLHEEHAEVSRRAVSDPSYLKDVDWSDQTIEVKEMAEEAVVGKTTRLAEEVVIRKQGTDRVETVRDKVRRQEVEVEHLDTGDKPTKS